MVRKGQVPDDQGSLKENSSTSSKVKKEKTKNQKSGKAPVVRDADGSVEHDDVQANGVDDLYERNGDADAEEDEMDQLEDDGDVEGSPKGHKRARINADGESIPIKYEVKKVKPRIATLPRDDDG